MIFDQRIAFFELNSLAFQCENKMPNVKIDIFKKHLFLDGYYLKALLREMCALPSETEWVEFKENNQEPQQIGEYISALSNSAALCGKTNAYVVWGGAG